MMMVLSATLPGHMVPLHSHPHEQIGMAYAGKAKLRIGDGERIVQKGDFYCTPANVSHGDTCIGDEPFVMLDIFYPVRGLHRKTEETDLVQNFNPRLVTLTSRCGSLRPQLHLYHSGDEHYLAVGVRFHYFVMCARGFCQRNLLPHDGA
jgi:hypothetical protein